MSIIQKAREEARRLNQFLHRVDLTKPALEPIYRDLFVRDLTKLGLEDDYYPVGGAANYSLLYLITRCLSELPVTNALEMGAGQSSVLISRLNAHLGKGVKVRTVEQDAAWAKHIQAKVDHEVMTAPLTGKTVATHLIQHYGGAYLDPAVKYDFVLIDGPTAHQSGAEYNRLGAIELLERNLADDFVLIVDDAERPGEEALAQAIQDRLRAAGRSFHQGTVMASKQQKVFASGAFSSAAFF